jgi:hypothetical protein
MVKARPIGQKFIKYTSGGATSRAILIFSSIQRGDGKKHYSRNKKNNHKWS